MVSLNHSVNAEEADTLDDRAWPSDRCPARLAQPREVRLQATADSRAVGSRYAWRAPLEHADPMVSTR